MIHNTTSTPWRIYRTSECSGTPLSDSYVTSQPIPDIRTYTDVTMTRVLEVAQINAETSARRAGVPVWAVLSIIAGLVLMAVGFAFNGPVSKLVWSWLGG